MNIAPTAQTTYSLDALKLPTFDAKVTAGWWILPIVAAGALAWVKLAMLVF